MIRIAAPSAILAAFAFALPALAQSMNMTPSTILANPASYDGKMVTVQGKVANFQTSNTRMGTVAVFQLCDTKCVLVIDQTNNSKYTNGDQGTATGIFQSSFKAPKRTFNNVVMIK